jgi:hypothetical protein
VLLTPFPKLSCKRFHVDLVILLICSLTQLLLQVHGMATLLDLVIRTGWLTSDNRHTTTALPMLQLSHPALALRIRTR